MSELYQVKEIEGKGFGCVATRDIKSGTLILSETPQLIFGKDPSLKQLYLKRHGEVEGKFNFLLNSPDWIKILVSSVNKMSETDRTEYLKLHSKYNEQEMKELPMELKLKIQASKSIIRNMDSDPIESEKILQIYEIYRTNGFSEGVKIKTSRFNHSCRPNANSFVMLPNITGLAEIRAITDIKANDEITISYDQDIPMEDRETRQKVLLDDMHFICACDLCLEEDEEIIDPAFDIEPLF